MHFQIFQACVKVLFIYFSPLTFHFPGLLSLHVASCDKAKGFTSVPTETLFVSSINKKLCCSLRVSDVAVMLAYVAVVRQAQFFFSGRGEGNVKRQFWDKGCNTSDYIPLASEGKWKNLRVKPLRSQLHTKTVFFLILRENQDKLPADMHILHPI